MSSLHPWSGPKLWWTSLGSSSTRATGRMWVSLWDGERCSQFRHCWKLLTSQRRGCWGRHWSSWTKGILMGAPVFDSALHSFVTTPTSQICTEADFPNTQAASATHKPRKVVFKNYKHFQTTSNESPVQQVFWPLTPPPPPSSPRTVMHTGMPEVVVHESSHEDTYNLLSCTASNKKLHAWVGVDQEAKEWGYVILYGVTWIISFSAPVCDLLSNNYVFSLKKKLHKIYITWHCIALGTN